MRIGQVDVRPYIYQTNTLSADSLNKVSAISDDLVSAKTDFAELVADDLSENLLRLGQSANFADILEQQFQMSRLNAARLLKPVDENEAMYQMFHK